MARSRGRRRKTRTRAWVVEGGVGAAVIATAVLVTTGPVHLWPSGSRTAPASAEPDEPEVARVGVRARSGAPETAAGVEMAAPTRSDYTDDKAVAYFRSRWRDRTSALVRDIRTTGGYLRIYTDLPEADDDSDAAITLCERGLEYLAAEGDASRVVFVQADLGENGNPVLANVLGPDDPDCRVTSPEPR
ncbi:hypothetical protein [Planotetraspora silvatica]|uniref:hypothetical protein n=1 Tax=Planotetraspora silvatica TaxID=234614 RepID=UPI001951CD9B|nr:hypothetical protein [Planotetraspora silvatica]